MLPKAKNLTLCRCRTRASVVASSELFRRNERKRSKSFYDREADSRGEKMNGGSGNS